MDVLKNFLAVNRRSVVSVAMLIAVVTGASACNSEQKASDPLADRPSGEMPVETLTVVSAPGVPPAITRKSSAKVVINLETREVRKRLADGVEYTFWTFGGTVPGPMLRVR